VTFIFGGQVNLNRGKCECRFVAITAAWPGVAATGFKGGNLGFILASMIFTDANCVFIRMSPSVL
jgi:hypothetical protein